jgi:hypothetical protein
MIHRRDALKGISLGAGSVLLSPMLRQLTAEASGDEGSPMRFVFVVEGNGLPPDQIQPVGIERKKNAQSQNDVDRLVDAPLDNHELPEALKPLNNYKDRLTIIQGLSGRICGGGHSNNFGALGAYHAKGGVGNSGSAIDETIDAAIAKNLPGIFPHVGLGISSRPEHSIIYNCSAWGPGQKLPTQCRPDLAYSTLFGSVAGGNAKQQFIAERNLFDFMVDDVKRLESRLVASERERLGHYLSAFESLRDRQSRLNEIENTLRKNAPVPSDKFQSDVETDRLDAHFDIGAAALISGLTNVVTIASGVGDPFFSVKFRGLGLDIDKHSIGHGKSYKDFTARKMSVVIRLFLLDLFAGLMTTVESFPEGDGTMLDIRLIFYLSDAAEGHHSRCWEWPVLFFGNLNGRFKAGNRFLNYPKYGNPGHRTMAHLYTTFLHAVGDRRERFGVADVNLRDLDQNGPLGELMA